MAPSAVPVESISNLPLKVANKSGVQMYPITSIEMSDKESTGRVLRVFRCLIADLCEQFKGGHPG